jgi:hypothetical protein
MVASKVGRACRYVAKATKDPCEDHDLRLQNVLTIDDCHIDQKDRKMINPHRTGCPEGIIKDPDTVLMTRLRLLRETSVLIDKAHPPTTTHGSRDISHHNKPPST